MTRTIDELVGGVSHRTVDSRAVAIGRDRRRIHRAQQRELAGSESGAAQRGRIAGLQQLREARVELHAEERALERAMRLAQQATLSADLFVVLGSSLTVFPAADFPVQAKQNGAALVIINRDPTPLDPTADLAIHASIGETLGSVVDEL